MKLKKILIDNPDGVTFVKKKLEFQKVIFKRGYYVALTDNISENPASDISKIENLAKQLNLKQFYFGYWKDSKTGIEYLDLSLHIVSKQKALTLAKTFKQKAIFDCYKLDSIYC